MADTPLIDNGIYFTPRGAPLASFARSNIPLNDRLLVGDREVILPPRTGDHDRALTLAAVRYKGHTRCIAITPRRGRCELRVIDPNSPSLTWDVVDCDARYARASGKAVQLGDLLFICGGCLFEEDGHREIMRMNARIDILHLNTVCFSEGPVLSYETILSAVRYDDAIIVFGRRIGRGWGATRLRSATDRGEDFPLPRGIVTVLAVTVAAYRDVPCALYLIASRDGVGCMYVFTGIRWVECRAPHPEGCPASLHYIYPNPSANNSLVAVFLLEGTCEYHSDADAWFDIDPTHITPDTVREFVVF